MDAVSAKTANLRCVTANILVLGHYVAGEANSYMIALMFTIMRQVSLNLDGLVNIRLLFGTRL